MVLCLVTLTDLYTRRAGLSPSAELLVIIVLYTDLNFWQERVKSNTTLVASSGSCVSNLTKIG